MWELLFHPVEYFIQVPLEIVLKYVCSLSWAEARWQAAIIFLLKASGSIPFHRAIIILWSQWTKQHMLVIPESLITVTTFIPLQTAWQLSVLVFPSTRCGRFDVLLPVHSHKIWNIPRMRSFLKDTWPEWNHISKKFSTVFKGLFCLIILLRWELCYHLMSVWSWLFKFLYMFGCKRI